MTTRVLILSGGSERYSDPWHPYPETSERLAGIVRELGDGFEVTISQDVDGRLADLSAVDVLIANTPGPNDEVPAAALEGAAAGLHEFLSRSVGVFALHASVTTLVGLAEWHDLMGARWIADETLHPPLGHAVVRPYPERHEIVSGLSGDFGLYDERYSRMRFAAPVTALVDHEFEGERHPLVWPHEVGSVRVVADVLGHGAESYDSAEHRELVARSVAWVARSRPAS